MSRVEVIERTPDWRKPVIAQSEEIGTDYLPERGDPRMGSGILHALQPADYQRVLDGMVCPQCLTPFPAPVGPEHMKVWRGLTSEDWRPELSGDQLAAIFMGQCPVCMTPMTAEILALQDIGETQNESDAWREEVAGFGDRAKAYYDELERRHRSTGARGATRIGSVSENVRRARRGEGPSR